MLVPGEYMELSNRELASLVWLTLLICIALVSRDVREAAWVVVEATFQRLIVTVVGLLAIYTVACVAILARQGLWTVTNLKTTLLWFVTFALVAIGRRAGKARQTGFIGATLREALAATVLIQFLVDTYTFSLPVELILMPLVTLITGMKAVGETKPEHAAAGRLLDRVLVIIGLGYLGHAAYQAAVHYREFVSIDNAREILVPIALSLMFLPFLYLFNVYVVYERVFIGIGWGINDRRLRRYAIWQAFLRLRTDVDFIERWRRRVVAIHPTTRAAVDAIFAELKTRKRIERNPPEIPSHRGWCPFGAQRFLGSEGFAMDDYHFVYDHWQSRSSPKALKRSLFDGTITYVVRGDEEAATALFLKLDMMNLEDDESADAEFMRLSAILLRNALGEDAAARLVERFTVSEQKDVTDLGYWRVTMTRKEQAFTSGPGYKREFVIQCVSDR